MKGEVHLLMVLHEKKQQQVLESKFCHRLQLPINPNQDLHQIQICSLRMTPLPEQLRTECKISMG